MKQSKQLQVAHKIVERERKKDSVVAISLFGSVAKRKEHSDSDLDIEIVVADQDEYDNVVEVIDGVYADKVIIPKDFMLMRLEKYPFLNYGYVSRKVIYDPTGFMEGVKKKAQSYFDAHPEVVEFWEEKEAYVRQMKAEGKKPMSAFKSYNEAEILFSKEKRVTRDFFREN